MDGRSGDGSTLLQMEKGVPAGRADGFGGRRDEVQELRLMPTGCSRARPRGGASWPPPDAAFQGLLHPQAP